MIPVRFFVARRTARSEEGLNPHRETFIHSGSRFSLTQLILAHTIVFMPELPEVEGNRYLCEQYLQGSHVTQIVGLEQGGGPRDGLWDEIVHESSLKEFVDATLNRTLLHACRKGKQLWLEFSKPQEVQSDSGCAYNASKEVDTCLMVHFGMTGSFVIRGHPSQTYKAFKIHDHEWPPRFCKFEMSFSNGEKLAYCDPRRIGRVYVLKSNDPLSKPPLINLAQDALSLSNLEQFASALCSVRTDVKTLLLNQEKLISGIGNWLADEILYQCRVHPKTKCTDLTMEKCLEIGNKIRILSNTACECIRQGREFPADWLFHFRWAKLHSDSGRDEGTHDGGERASSSPKRKATDAYGNAIQFESVGGRTSAIVLALQQKPQSSTTHKQIKSDKKSLTCNNASAVENAHPVTSKYFSEPMESLNELAKYKHVEDLKAPARNVKRVRSQTAASNEAKRQRK